MEDDAMHAHKFSISLPQNQYDFIESYKSEHNYKSRSDVIKKALQLLHQLELEAAYREADNEIDTCYDVTLLDGIAPDETW